MVPLFVLNTLKIVRQSARTNMLDRKEVIRLMRSWNHVESADYIEKRPDEYMDILNEFGEWLTKKEGS